MLTLCFKVKYMEERKFDQITPRAILEYCYDHSKMVNAEALKRLEVRTREHGQIKMLSGPYLGKFLSMISSIIRPKYILEIGGFTGYGTACLAMGLQEEGKIISIEKNPELKGFADDIYEDLGISHKIDQRIGDARDIISTLDYSFDLVFIDAAKRQYIDYFEMVLPCIRKGGVILADNTLWKGSLVHPSLDKMGEGLDGFNKHIKSDTRVDNILMPLDDGVHFIIKK